MRGDRTVEAERAALVAEGSSGGRCRWFAPDAAKAAPGMRPAPGEGRSVSRGPGAAPVPSAGGKGVVNEAVRPSAPPDGPPHCVPARASAVLEHGPGGSPNPT